MLAYHALEMADRLLVLAARHLELCEPHERIVALGRERILDDDGAQVALGVGRSLREHGAPVQRFDVARGAGISRIELALYEVAPRVSLPRRHQPARTLEHVVASGRWCRSVGVRWRLHLRGCLRCIPLRWLLLSMQRGRGQHAAGEE